MSREDVCKTIFDLYAYADAFKMIHYSCEKNHTHQLSDDIRNTILTFTDELAEQCFGDFVGKPTYSEMKLSTDIQTSDEIDKLIDNTVKAVEDLYNAVQKDSKMSGTVSLIDDFKGAMAKYTFLDTFDRMGNH